jgi:hypothetical protein
LAVASILATPYAFFYDLTLVSAAVALVAVDYGTALSRAEVLVLVAAWLLPLGMGLDILPPVSAAIIGLFLAVILRRLVGGWTRYQM